MKMTGVEFLMGVDTPMHTIGRAENFFNLRGSFHFFFFFKGEGNALILEFLGGRWEGAFYQFHLLLPCSKRISYQRVILLCL